MCVCVCVCVCVCMYIIFWRGFCYRVRALARQTEGDREIESEKSPPRGDGHAAIPSSPFSSRDLGHAHTCAQREFKPPGLGLEPCSTRWEPCDVTIMPSAGSSILQFLLNISLSMHQID